MAIYTESELVEYKGSKFYRATASAEIFLEKLKLIWYTLTRHKQVQFRVSIEKEFWDKNIKSK